MNSASHQTIGQPDHPRATGEIRKAYSPPAILHELTLETRAGSPDRVDPNVDPVELILGIPTQ